MLDEYNGEASLNKGQKRALETASLPSEEDQPTVASSVENRNGDRGNSSAAKDGRHTPLDISDSDGAKVLKKIGILAKNYEEKSNRPRTFINDVSETLGATGLSSKYATFIAKNGKKVTIRLSNHNATVKNFDNVGEDDGISIVISGTANTGIKNNGDAHIVEFFYPEKVLRKAENKVLVSIIRSIEQSLFSGEYKDTTGLAEREEVNADEIRQQKVYHGSSAEFDTFDHSHMGEGEGSQAFGWGTYVTSSEDTGLYYAEHVADYKGFRKLMDSLRYEPNLSVDNNNTTYDDLKSQISFLEKEQRKKPEIDFDIPRLKEYLKQWKLIGPKLYDVEIPDDTGSNYLDWQEPVSDELLEKVADALTDQESDEVNADYYLYKMDQFMDMNHPLGSDLLTSSTFCAIK